MSQLSSELSLASLQLGQRWISDAEIELGLGTLLRIEGRQLTVFFPLQEETRVYSLQSAPLTRVELGPGDLLMHEAGWSARVDQVETQEGLRIYLATNAEGESVTVVETQLSAALSFQGPKERLLTGQLDRLSESTLRAVSHQAQQRLASDPLRGLRGPRVELIPHQLYIAQEVGQRLAPRVLLADEVGLGKTIEAGLILHQQLACGRAQRALILVPPALCHQWLVELLRRFGLAAQLLDAGRLEADEQCIEQAQIALCRLDWVVSDPAVLQRFVDEPWDLLILDEAHHLDWSADAPGPVYQSVAQLAQKIPGLLLLTATPEQAGAQGFFAQLHLLDPLRYPSLADFQAEEGRYQSVARVLSRIQAGEPLAEADQTALLPFLCEDTRALLGLLSHPEASDEQRQLASQQLSEQLLDRYGTGRVLFRNRRASVGGFPARQLHPAPLACPVEYASLAADFAPIQRQAMAEALAEQPWPWALLYPERVYQATAQASGPWWQFDPRVDWLIERLKALKGEKLLLICHHADTALDLSEALRRRTGLIAGVFHENQSLLERDQVAAWFTDPEDGTPLLICSEIGSEGRNFQFAHHLVLFDLPPHPDALEQRIGRLDRIGQTQTVQLHLPYFEGSAQAAWFAWCDQGLDQFTAPRPAAPSLWQAKQTELEDQLLKGVLDETWLAEIQRAHAAAQQALEAGRHRLLEMASHRPEVSGPLVEALGSTEQDAALRELLERGLDVYRIPSEDLDTTSLTLQPDHQSDTRLLADLPIDLEAGQTVTLSRQQALQHEDWLYITWEHPLIRNLLEGSLSSSLGNACVALLKNPALPPGTLLVEVFYCFEPASALPVGAARFLPPQSLRLLLNEQGQNLAEKVSFAGLNRQLVKARKHLGRDVVRLRRQALRDCLAKADALAQGYLGSMTEQAHTQMNALFEPEIARTRALQQAGAPGAEQALQVLQQHKNQIEPCINQARLRLDLVRVLVTAG